MILILTGPESVVITNSTFAVTIIDTDGMYRQIIKCDINIKMLRIKIYFYFIFFLHFYTVVTF